MEFTIILNILILLLMVAMIAAWWVMFERDGEPGWAAIVPFYNLIVLCKVARKPDTYWLFLLIPCASIYFWFVLCSDIAKKYRKDTGFAVLLFFYIGFPILAFGGAAPRPKARKRYDDDDYDDDDYDRPRKSKRRDEDDYEDDRPKKPKKRLDDEDDYEDDRPKKPKKRLDDEDDAPPPPKAKKPLDDDDDAPPPPRKPKRRDDDDEDDAPPRRRR